MDINLSPVAVNGGRRNTHHHLQHSRPLASSRPTLKPSPSCNSCSDDQQSFTSDTDREKSLNSTCCTDNENINSTNPFTSHHSHQRPHHHLQQNQPLDRDLDSPDQDYDFNSRFSPPPTDNSYHSENHCNCYDDADNEHHDTDDDDDDEVDSQDFIGSRTRRTNQYRQKRRAAGVGGGHRSCAMMSAVEGDDEEEVLQVTKDTVCIIESEARGGVSSARELNEKTMAAAASKARQQQQQQKKVAGGGGGLSSPGSKSYHNICARNGQSANFGTIVSGSSSNGNEAAGCGKLLDKVCINNSCRSVAVGGGVSEAATGTVNNSSSSRSNNRNHHQHGINEFMHGFPATRTPSGSAAAAAAGGGPAMQLATSYNPEMKWTRNNIAVTMERYEPSTSSSSVSPCHSPNGHSRVTQQQQQQQQGQQTRHHYPFNHHAGHHPGAPHNANFHHDYSYAYYEPGAAMRHANIPGSPSSSAGPSNNATAAASHHPLPPNSIQALLLKSHGYQAKLKKQQQQQAAIAAVAQMVHKNGGQPGPGNSSRHAYTTRYGTQENIYEEIGNEDRMRMMMASASTNGQSMVSLNQSLVEEEFRQVHNRHRRILGELNLSVEAMIMPVNPPVEPAVAGPSAEESVEVHVHDSTHGSPVKVAGATQKLMKGGKRNEFMMKPIRNAHLMGRGGCATTATTTDALTGACGVADCSQLNGDMDSGFSGSSSGASYVGSLRYAKSQCCPNGNGLMMPRGLVGMGQRAYEDPGLSSFSTRSSSSYGSSKSSHNLQRMMRSAEDPGPSSAHHHHAAMALNGMPGTSATLKPMSKNASFWSRKGWKIIPGLTSPGASGANKTHSPVNVLSG